MATDELFVGTVAQVKLGRWGKLAWFPFQTLIAILLVITGVENVVNPGHTTIQKAPLLGVRTVGVLYLLSGVLMLLGMWRHWVRVELVSLLLVVIGFVIWLVMGFLYDSEKSLQQALVFLPLTWAAVVKGRELLEGRTTIQLERTDR